MPAGTPAETMARLAAAGIDFSVPAADLADWLSNPEFTPYPAIAEALLTMLGDQKLAQPVFIDVIVFNYEERAPSPRLVTDVVVSTLKAAILEGSNNRYGTAVATFEGLLLPPSPIQVKWLALGGAAGFLGAPVGPETPTLDGTGRTRDFAGGTIAWHPVTGAHAVGGAIGTRWRELGRERWGFPFTDEEATPDGQGRFNHFRTVTLPGNPECSIYWHPSTGAHEVTGGIRQKWAELGWERGIGYPLGPDLPRRGGGRIQEFQKNSIGWTGGSGAFLGRITVSQVITTPPGTALGGEAAFDLVHDGTYRFRGKMHDSGLTDYDFRVRATIASGDGLVLTAQKGGEVEGTESFPDPNRTFLWDEPGTSALLQQEFPFLRPETFMASKEYSTSGVIGTAGDLLVDLASFFVTAYTAGAQVAVAMLAAKELNAFAGTPVTGLGGIPGTVVTAAGSFVFGSTYAIPIFVGTAFATQALFKQRPIRPDEYEFANLVFRGTLPPAERIVLTNLSGLGGRAFTVPALDQKTVLVNLGDGFSFEPGGPMRHTKNRFTVPGQRLIHELTHAWQFARNSFVPGYLCRGVLPSDYGTPNPGTAWGDFSLEEQAVTVDKWFGRHGQNPESIQPWATLGELRGLLEGRAALQDAYFPYIDAKVRLGLAS